MKSWAEGRSSAAARDILSTGSTFRRSRDGAAAVEFALTVMLLVLFLFGTITFGWMFYLDNNWETAAREAARRLASGDVDLVVDPTVTCASPEAQDQTLAYFYACRELPNWGDTIRVNASCDAADQSVRVEVSADGEDVALADIFGFFNGKTLSATVEMRKEEEC